MVPQVGKDSAYFSTEAKRDYPGTWCGSGMGPGPSPRRRSITGRRCN